MNTRISKGGVFALMVAHCAGMVDLVALPVWIAALVQDHRLDPQQAGGIVTLFLVGVVLASVTVARRLGALNARVIAALGYLLAGAGFGALSMVTDLTAVAVLHLLSGLCAGAALSVTHGTIGRASNPHRLFALVGIALGVFAIGFLGAAAPMVHEMGGVALFRMLGAVMTVAGVVAAVTFPRAELGGHVSAAKPEPIPTPAWFAVAGISIMALVQAMTFSFLERAGHARGFSVAQITGVLVAIGVVNLFPAAAAAILERRLSANWVLAAGPIVQAVLSAVIMVSTSFAPYAAAASVLAAVMIFTHTFAFGVTGRLDRGGRALAATPAMLMAGAAIGPVLGGTLIKYIGFWSIGVTAAALAGLALVCFFRAQFPDPSTPTNLGANGAKESIT